MTYHHGNLRKALLERAVQIIAERGVEALSLRALAQDLGVSHGAPSRHFRDKSALLRTLATEGHTTLAQHTFSASDEAGPDPLERYAELGRAYVRFSLDHPAYYKAGHHPEVAAQADAGLKEAYGRRMATLREATRQAQAAGWLADTPTDVALVFGIATVRGLAALLNDPLFHSDIGAIDPYALIDDVVRLIIDPPAVKAAQKRRRYPAVSHGGTGPGARRSQHSDKEGEKPKQAG